MEGTDRISAAGALVRGRVSFSHSIFELNNQGIDLFQMFNFYNTG